MAPSGLYARLCHAFSSFFSPLGKLAGTAIYFANVFSLLFNFLVVASGAQLAQKPMD